MMANTSSFGVYLLATLLFLSGANHSLALTNNPAENSPRAAHPKQTSKEDILELAIQSVMRAMEDGFARTAREVREIKEGMASLKYGMNSSKEHMAILKVEVKSLEEEMKSSKKGMESLEVKLSDTVYTFISSVMDIMYNATVCPTEPDPTPSALPSSNCHDLLRLGHSSSGVYTVTISGKNVKVYCDMVTDGGGWTVIQRRDDIEPHVDFYRGWADYKRGFGDLEGEFWLGLDNTHGLTSDPSTPMRLRIDLEDWEGEERVALYSTFRVQDEQKKYKLTVGGYEKGPGGGDPGDSLDWQNHMAFTTRDQDNDGYDGGSNCAKWYKGGWWYDDCHYSNLNGVYLKGEHGEDGHGIIWKSWKGLGYSLRRAAMKIRPR